MKIKRNPISSGDIYKIEGPTKEERIYMEQFKPVYLSYHTFTCIKARAELFQPLIILSSHFFIKPSRTSSQQTQEKPPREKLIQDDAGKIDGNSKLQL